MIRIVALLAAVAMFSGCVGSALESKREEPEVFRLTMPETADAGAALPRAIAVGRPRAPVSLDTERIAVAGPATRFDYYAGVRWAEPAPRFSVVWQGGEPLAAGRDHLGQLM